jgi:hypothetical protein
MRTYYEHVHSVEVLDRGALPGLIRVRIRDPSPAAYNRRDRVLFKRWGVCCESPWMGRYHRFAAYSASLFRD